MSNTDTLRAKRFFAYDPDDATFTLWATADEAKIEAESILEAYRDEAAGDGWSESVTDICWGEVVGAIEQTSYIPRPPEGEIDEEGEDRDGNYWAEDHWSHIADYELQPVNTRPAAERSRMFEELWKVSAADPDYFEIGRKFQLWFEKEFAAELREQQ